MATITGTPFNDTIGTTVSGGVAVSAPFTGATGGPDSITGLDGNDSIRGLGGPDTLDGGTGNDTIWTGTASVVASGIWRGGAGDDLFFLNGPAIGLTLNGGSGADRLAVLTSFDLGAVSITAVETLTVTLDATVTLTAAQLDGFDTVRLNGSSATGIDFTLRLLTGGTAAVVVDVLFEEVRIEGSAQADSLNLGGSTASLYVRAGGGADSIIAGSGEDWLEGGAGNDTLRGGLENDTLIADGDGTDSLLGEADDDTFWQVGSLAAGTLDGGLGDNTLIADSAYTIAGAVVITGMDALLLLPSFAGGVPATLSLTGPQFNGFSRLDVLTTFTAREGRIQLTSAADATFALNTGVLNTGGLTSLVGGWGDLLLTGSAAGDRLSVTLGASLVAYSTTLAGGDGNDTILASGGAASILEISGGNGDDALLGTDGNDHLLGDAGQDALLGGLGSDLLEGGAGNDTLEAGSGAAPDTLKGGLGQDRLLLGSGDQAFGEEDDDRFLVQGEPLLSAATIIDGGTGLDRLSFDGAVTLAPGITVQQVEVLAIGTGTVTLASSLLDGFQTLTGIDPLGAAGSLVLTGGGVVGSGLPLAVNTLTTLSILGTGVADTLILEATGTAITVDAGAGADTVSLGAGAHRLRGGTGNDRLWAFNGNAVEGGTDDDVVFLGGNLSAAVTLDGGLGTDTLSFAATAAAASIGVAVTLAGFESILLGSVPVTLAAHHLAAVGQVGAGFPGTGAITLSAGGAAAVTLTGFTAFSLTGSGGDDSLTLGIGAGGTTPLTVAAGFGNDAVTGGAGNDTLQGEDGNDSLDGGAGGSDLLVGGAGDDRLVAGDGDTLLGGLGTNTFILAGSMATGVLAGGPGLDTLRVQASATIADAVQVSGIETLALGQGVSLTLRQAALSGVNAITADGGAGSASLILGAGNPGGPKTVSGLASLSVTASAGADMLALASAATAITFDAGDGNDDIGTGGGNDSLQGGAGDDTLDGGGGLDTLSGGEGNDQLRIGSGDRADGGTGDDRLILAGALALPAILDGGDGLDTLVTQGVAGIAAGVSLLGLETLALTAADFGLTAAQLAAFATLAGDGGGTAGALALTAGGTASVAVQAGLLTLAVTGSATDDALSFAAGAGTAITVLAGDGKDRIQGGSGADSLEGGAGRDQLRGGEGNDSLSGGAGSDVLIGGAGVDRLRGGAGQDRFRFDRPDEAGDVIADFVAGTDLLQVDAGSFGGGLVGGAALGAGQLVVQAANAATAPPGTGQFVFNSATSRLFWDADGAGGAAGVLVAVLSGVTGLATTDIVVVA